LDEDNAASRFTNVEGWTIHRKRAWTTRAQRRALRPDRFHDSEPARNRNPEAQVDIRSWMKHLSAFVHELDLVKAEPNPQLVRQAPEHLVASVLDVAGQDYAIHLADAREVTDKGLGDPIDGELALSLPDGDWQTTFWNPVNGSGDRRPEVQGRRQPDSTPEIQPRSGHRLRRP